MLGRIAVGRRPERSPSVGAGVGKRPYGAFQVVADDADLNFGEWLLSELDD